MAKIQISIDDDLLKRVDNFSEKSYQSRSGLFCLAVNEYLNTREFLVCCRDMSASLKKIADSDKVDKEDLEDFKEKVRFLEFMSGTLKN